MIRSIIGFDGLIITDDINMKALEGNHESRVLDAYNAGCNLVLDCSGNNENFIKFDPVSNGFKRDEFDG